MGLPWDFRTIAADRVTIDLLRRDDLDALYELQSDPEVCRYMLYDPRTRSRVSEVLDRDAAATRLEKAGDYVQPAIRDSSGALVGTLYFHLTNVEDRTAEIGWALLRRAQGKGYARDAAALMIDTAFAEMGLHRVYAELDPRNEASVALCLRLGMRHEAHFVEHMWSKGEWTDTGHYAVLEREWAARADG